MNSADTAWADQFGAMLTMTVRRFGWSIQYIGGDTCVRPGCTCAPSDEPPFAYTVGLFGMNHPELLIFDQSQRTSAAVLNELGERVRSGSTLMPGVMLEVDEWERRIVPEIVPNPGAIVFCANDFYQRPDEHSVPVLQLTYDDPHGRFPWEPGYASTWRQPRPGTFAA